MKRFTMIAITALLMAAAVAPFAHAFTMSEKVVVSNELIAIARVPAGGLSAGERINRVNERLAYILGFEPLAPRNIYTVREGGSVAIMVGNRLLMTVTSADARANNTTVSALAREWLNNARAVIPQARPNANLPVARAR